MASIGAIDTILALGVDPIMQQTLSIKADVVNSTNSATIGRAQSFVEWIFKIIQYTILIYLPVSTQTTTYHRTPRFFYLQLIWSLLWLTGCFLELRAQIQALSVRIFHVPLATVPFYLSKTCGLLRIQEYHQRIEREVPLRSGLKHTSTAGGCHVLRVFFAKWLETEQDVWTEH